MKAIKLNSFGLPDDVITLEDGVEKPQLDDTKHMLVEVHAFPINIADVRSISGDFKFVMKPKSFPTRYGGIVSGKVTKVPEDCSTFSVGDKVFAEASQFKTGGMSEMVQLPISKACRIPSNLSLVESVTVATNATTAYSALQSVNPSKGGKILILGAAGAIGTFAVQFAKKHFDLEVHATSTKTDLVQSLGASSVISYQDPNYVQNLMDIGPFDYAIDCHGGNYKHFKSSNIIKPGKNGGVFATVIGESPEDMKISNLVDVTKVVAGMSKTFMVNRFTQGKSPKYVMVNDIERVEKRAEICHIIEECDIKPVFCEGAPFDFTEDGVRNAFNAKRTMVTSGIAVVKVKDE